MTMSRTALLAAALLALAACKGSTDPDPDPALAAGEDRFDTPSLTSYTPYTDGGYDWSIQGGALVGTGPGIQAVLIRNGTAMADGWVETVSSGADDGGLVLRFQDGTHYYLLAFRDDGAPFPRGGENLAVYHHVGSAYHQMWVEDLSWPRGTSHVIRFEAAGNLLRVYFDGVQRVELGLSPVINDPTPYTGSGGVGVRYYGQDGSWITRFDNFRWNPVR